MRSEQEILDEHQEELNYLIATFESWRKMYLEPYCLEPHRANESINGDMQDNAMHEYIERKMTEAFQEASKKRAFINNFLKMREREMEQL